MNVTEQKLFLLHFIRLKLHYFNFDILTTKRDKTKQYDKVYFSVLYGRFSFAITLLCCKTEMATFLVK